VVIKVNVNDTWDGKKSAEGESSTLRSRYCGGRGEWVKKKEPRVQGFDGSSKRKMKNNEEVKRLTFKHSPLWPSQELYPSFLQL